MINDSAYCRIPYMHFGGVRHPGRTAALQCCDSLRSAKIHTAARNSCARTGSSSIRRPMDPLIWFQSISVIYEFIHISYIPHHGCKSPQELKSVLDQSRCSGKYCSKSEIYGVGPLIDCSGIADFVGTNQLGRGVPPFVSSGSNTWDLDVLSTLPIDSASPAFGGFSCLSSVDWMTRSACS